MTYSPWNIIDIAFDADDFVIGGGLGIMPIFLNMDGFLSGTNTIH